MRSRTPRGLILAILFLHVPAILVNCHPNTISLFAWTFISRTDAPTNNAGLKVLSHTQVALTLPILVLAFPVIVVNVHPRRILLSD